MCYLFSTANTNSCTQTTLSGSNIQRLDMQEVQKNQTSHAHPKVNSQSQYSKQRIVYIEEQYSQLLKNTAGRSDKLQSEELPS